MRLYLAALVLPLALVGCGGGDEPSEPDNALEGVKQMADEAPACSDVWVVGQTLPDDYEGCVDEDGVLQVATTLECQDDSALISFDDGNLWVVAPGEIQQSPGDMAADKAGYGKAYSECVG